MGKPAFEASLFSLMFEGAFAHLDCLERQREPRQPGAYRPSRAAIHYFAVSVLEPAAA